MIWGGRRLNDLGRLGLVLAVLALAVRLVSPAGFMIAPAPLAGILPTLVICTGEGAITVAVGPDGKALKGAPGHQDKAPGDKSGHACAFTGVAVFTAPVLAIGPIVDRPPQRIPSGLQLSQRPGLGLAAPPPLSTGPPPIV